VIPGYQEIDTPAALSCLASPACSPFAYPPAQAELFDPLIFLPGHTHGAVVRHTWAPHKTLLP